MSHLDFSSLSPEARIQIWRETIAHLRYLNDEVWKRFQFFLLVDLVILVVTFGMFWARPRFYPAFAILFVALGVVLTLAARYILKRNRIYYLQMLLKKTLLEKEAGFYEMKLAQSETDLAFPWRLSPEIFEMLQKNPGQWTEQNIDAPKTIARRLFQVYEVVLGLYVALLLVAVFCGLIF